MNLAVLQGIFSSGTPISEALLNGIGLRVKTWGAFATLIVDPISAELSLNGGQTLEINDSSVSLSAELRSKGEFFSSVADMVDGSADVSALEPSLVVPLNAEIIFGLEVGVNGANVKLSPIVRVESSNVVGGFAIDFDVGLDIFLDQYGLDDVFSSLTDLLTKIADHAPDLQAGDSSSAVNGLLGVIEDFSDFSDGLQQFIDLITAGNCFLSNGIVSLLVELQSSYLALVQLNHGQSE